jgi:hypothetical protein
MAMITIITPGRDANYFYSGEHNRNSDKHGKGVLTFNNGDEYVGDFANNKQEGQGKYTFKHNGATHEGTYLANTLMEGLMTWPSNGNTFKGKFDSGRPTKGELWVRDRERTIDVYFERPSNSGFVYRVHEQGSGQVVGTLVDTCCAGELTFDPEYEYPLKEVDEETAKTGV